MANVEKIKQAMAQAVMEAVKARVVAANEERKRTNHWCWSPVRGLFETIGEKEVQRSQRSMLGSLKDNKEFFIIGKIHHNTESRTTHVKTA